MAPQLLTTYLSQEKIDYDETEPPANIGEIIRLIANVAQNARETTTGR